MKKELTKTLTKTLILSAIISSSIFLTSCEDKEDQKILDDLDLQIQEFNDIKDIDSKADQSDVNQSDANQKDEVKTIKEKQKNNQNNQKISQKKEIKKFETTKTISEFAKCLTKNWVKMYWTSWCWHCKDQKDMFWDDFKNINFTDCDKDRKTCKIAWITWYPTWVINWKKYPWVQSFEELWNAAWCKLIK